MPTLEARIQRLESRLEGRTYPRIIFLNSGELLSEVLTRFNLPYSLGTKEQSYGSAMLVVRRDER